MLNLKNPETHKFAKDLALLTGESMTEAVTIALRERLDRVRNEKADLIRRLTVIADDCAAHMKEPWLSVDHGEFLYDEKGLPK